MHAHARSSAPSPAPGRATLHADRIRSVLHDRYLGGLVDLPGRTWRCLLLESGELTRMGPDGPERFFAPTLLWMPWDRSLRMKALAGSSGADLMMTEATLANAIGHKPEAAALRLLSARAYAVALGDHPAVLSDAAGCFDMILREHEAAAPGMETMIEAQVRVLLVMLWRSTARPLPEENASAGSARILEAFRQILEAHLRDRWTVTRHAAELGISTDRLHDICTKVLGKSPQRLIHERLNLEARVLLARSPQTLDQIAGHLGFRSAAQFSTFFKLHNGVPPGGYRKTLRQTGGEDAPLDLRGYADWP